jgi:rhamnosyltransferase
LALLSDDEILFLMNETTRAREIHKLHSDISSLHSDVSSLNSDVTALNEQIYKLIHSKSWKITEPLRYVVNKLHSINSIAQQKLKKYDRLFEKGSTFNGNIVYKTNFISHGGNKICIFSHFDKNNIIDEYVVLYLKELRANQCDIVFVSTADGLDTNELAKISSICSQIIIKENIGYDFGAWSHGINACNTILNKYNKLILCNDSVYAPLFKFDAMFEKMDKSNLDAWSITDSHEISYHMQSYFLVFNKKIINNGDFLKLWKSYIVYKNKRNIIEKYEIGLSRLLKKKGFSIGAYCESKKITDKASNITHKYWKELIVKYSCPTIKVELLRDNPTNTNIENIEDIIKKNTDFEYELILNHLRRVSIKKDLQVYE